VTPEGNRWPERINWVAVSKWAYIILGFIAALALCSVYTTQATAATVNRAMAEQAARDRKYNEHKNLQDTINAQTIKLLEEQQNEIDALKAHRQKK
jgi:predicted secreted protein